MICSHWRMQIALLWLLGCCIGGLIKDKSATFSLAAEASHYHYQDSPDPPQHHQNHHHHRHSSSASGPAKFLHSSVGSSSKRREQGGGIHSVSSVSSPSASSSNSILSHHHHNSHHNSNPSSSSHQQQHHHHPLNNNNNYQSESGGGGDYGEDDEELGFLEAVDPGEDSSPVVVVLDDAVQEKLRSTKGTGSSSSSSSVGSGGGGGGGTGGSQGLDQHSHLRSSSGSGNDGSSSEYEDSNNNNGESVRGGGGDEQVEKVGSQHQQQQQQGPKEQQEKLLLQQLMRGYERDVRPVRNASQAVVVKVGITLTQIFDMDEKNQVLTTNVWLDQEWYDELLKWDPEDFGGLEMIRIPCERIWLPDIVLYNNADDYTRGYMPSRAMVQYDGNVFWPPPTKFRSTCAVDVTYFPFDDQTCTLKLGSWTYNGYQVDVTNRTAKIDLDNYVPNGEWDLLRADIKRNVVVYPCCPEPFPDVTIKLVIRRKTLYYIYNIVLPCMMLSALTLLVFCLPPDSGEKIALGITVLLAFSVFMLAISEALPETSESIPLIGIYLTAVMAITSISVIVTVVVLNLHYLGPRVRPVPAWLKCLLPEDDVNFIRQKSMLIPATSRHPRSGSLKRGHVYIPHKSTNSAPSAYHQQHQLDMAAATADEIIKECSSTESVSVSHVKTVREQSQPPAYDDAVDFTTSEKETLQQRFRKRRRGTTPAGGGGVSTPSSSTVPLSSTHHNAVSALPSTAGIEQASSTATTMAAAAIAAAAARRSGGGGGTGLEFMYPQITSSSSESPGGGGGGGGVGQTDNKDSISMCEDLVQAVRYLMSIQEQVESQNVLVAEWRLVAQAVDRILFWIFATMTIVSSTVLLVIFPLYKRSTNYDPTSDDNDGSGGSGGGEEMIETDAF